MSLTAQGDPVSALLQNPSTLYLLAGLVVWRLLAGAARWIILKALPNVGSEASAGLVWGSFRLALLVATVTALVGWLAAMTMGLALQAVLIEAVLLLVLVTAFTGVLGGAVFDSMLAVRHWRERRT